MPAKYASADAGLRLTMALLFLMSATTKVTETTAIQAYMHAYGVPGMLVWPAACFEYAAGLCLLLRRALLLRLSDKGMTAGLAGGSAEPLRTSIYRWSNGGTRSCAAASCRTTCSSIC